MDLSDLTPDRLRIALYPAATVNSASSRLRCYGLGRELAKLGYPVRVGMDPAQPPEILFVQKIINSEVLEFARRVDASGGIVIYDIDDYGDEALGSLKADEATFNQFMQLVSVVVVDTDTRQEVFLKEPGFTQIGEHWVVPDPIDYVESSTRGQQRPVKAKGELLHACWFGNAPNIVPALPYLDALVHADEVADVSVMTNGNYVDYFYTNHPQFKTSAWALDSFPSLFSGMDFCVLIHSTSLEGVQKSNNKMLASLALGVVPFVSRTPAYTETAEQMGIPELVIDEPGDVLERIKPEHFAAIAEKVHGDYCSKELEKYYPAVSAKIFSDKLQAFLRKTRTGLASQVG
jgi:hypothetical protein